VPCSDWFTDVLIQKILQKVELGSAVAASTYQALREMARPGPILEKKTVWCKNGPI
jgi:hypothetical protein